VNNSKFMELAGAVEAKIPINSIYAEKCSDKLLASLDWTGRFIDESSQKP